MPSTTSTFPVRHSRSQIYIEHIGSRLEIRASSPSNRPSPPFVFLFLGLDSIAYLAVNFRRGFDFPWSNERNWWTSLLSFPLRFLWWSIIRQLGGGWEGTTRSLGGFPFVNFFCIGTSFALMQCCKHQGIDILSKKSSFLHALLAATLFMAAVPIAGHMSSS